jgi:hypothetical protein
MTLVDELRSYGVAHRKLVPEAIYVADEYANNEVELSRRPAWVRD